LSLEQLALDVHMPAPEPRTYWEHRGPGVWEPVTVRTRYAAPGPPPEIPFPHVQLPRTAPRNVLVERADGSRDVRPVRLLRVRPPSSVRRTAPAGGAA
jgi:hypothetical protein